MNSSPVTLVGNIVAAPEVAQLASGQSKMTFAVAVEHRFQRNGEWESKPSFIQITAWRDLADRADGVLEKGLRVMVAGRLDQRSWVDNEGKNRSVVEVVADDIAVSVRGISGITRRSLGTSHERKPAAVAAESDEAPW